MKRTIKKSQLIGMVNEAVQDVLRKMKLNEVQNSRRCDIRVAKNIRKEMPHFDEMSDGAKIFRLFQMYDNFNDDSRRGEFLRKLIEKCGGNPNQLSNIDVYQYLTDVYWTLKKDDDINYI